MKTNGPGHRADHRTNDDVGIMTISLTTNLMLFSLF
jgi:hypothetical protein